MTGATCQQLTVTCPSVANVFAYLKINTPANPLGTVLYGTGTDGNGLYDTIFTFGKTAVQNVFNAGFRTVQISWGTPFNTAQPGGWVQGPEAFSPHPAVGPPSRTTFTPRFRTTAPSPCAQPPIAEAPAPSPTCSRNIPTTSPWPKSPADLPPPVSTGDACASKGSEHLLRERIVGTCFGVDDGAVWDPAYSSERLLLQRRERHSPSRRLHVFPER